MPFSTLCYAILIRTHSAPQGSLATDGGQETRDPRGYYPKCTGEESGPSGQSATIRHPGGNSPLVSHSRFRLAVPSTVLSGHSLRRAGATGLVTAMVAAHEYHQSLPQKCTSV
jgi:hypothetical protein